MRNEMGGWVGSQFQAVAPLGSGASGAVYEAIDLRTGQRVALKQLDDTSAASLARFKSEFRVLSDFHHPHLVGLRELIEDRGRWTIVMELVPGSDFLSFVRGPAQNDNRLYDEARLRGALLGMARGLVALHGFGVLHRDLKPSNVRVTPDGRAVLLDFGLVTHIDRKQQSTHVSLFGTVPYMAPEQATSAAIGPPADWYALGVCLFEALTGQTPFDGATAYEILEAKQTRPAPRASSVRRDVPPDLDALCAHLLERDPAQRAGAREVFALLGSESELGEGAEQLATGPAHVPFAGRAPELLQLERAFARVEEGALRFVLVEGESGVGKSELVAEFVRRERVREPSLLALHGRCYETEQVAYKALDGCVDELSQFLQRLPEQECAALLPARAGLLTQLFPTLRAVRAIAKAQRIEPSAEPSARRLEAFAALAALLHKLAQERPVVLVIDDLQWADTESFRLLMALIEDTKPPPVLIVATIRPPEELDADVRAGLESLRRKQRLEVVPVLGLPLQEAAALARRLLGPSATEAACQLIASESGGHPLFLSELIQFVRSQDLATRGALTLETALRARIGRLEPHARELLELVALAGRPYGAQIFARALDGKDVEEPARTLLAAKLLRLRKHQELGVHHDRIRRAAVELIARVRAPQLHRRLAHALAADANADLYAVEQAQHWDRAGERDRAIDAYGRAADAALAALAFVRAADLCARALQLGDGERSERSHRLLVVQAHALACAGRSREAAGCYDRAIAQAGGAQSHELRARHTEQLLLSGDLGEGLSRMRELLADLGVQLPRGTLSTLLAITIHRLWLALRGRRLRTEREPRPGEEQLVFTTLVIGTFANAIAPIHPLAMMLLVLHGARLSYRLPLLNNLVRLYTALGWLRVLDGSPSAAQSMFDKAHEIAHRVESDEAVATALLAEGSAALLGWDFPKAASLLERAHHILQTRCPDQPWNLRNVRYHLGLAWYALGRHGQLATETKRWIAEARERNDRLTVALLIGMGYGFLRHLMRDDPEVGLLELDGAMRDVPSEPYSFVHVGALTARMTTLLYKGGPAAHDWLDGHLSGKRLPFLLRSPSVAQNVRVLRGQALLHALGGRTPARRARLLARVKKDARFLLRRGSSSALAHGHLLLAQVRALEGRRDKALAAARAARLATSMHADTLGGRLARYLEALLETGTHDDPRCLEVLALYRDEGWQNPLAFMRAMLPATHELHAPRATAAPEPGLLLLDRYEVVRTLGSGGFSRVFAVREAQTGRSLAIKELSSKHPRSLERFKREFRQLRDIHHPNLVRLEALLEHAGSWYIAMELLTGEPLVSACRPGGSLDRTRLGRAFAGLCEGLAALHAAGFAHRDVSPENVCVSADGRAVLLDFGLLGRIGDDQDTDAVGKLEYGAPEQLAGAPPSASADVYALGTCLYEALFGVLPFAADVPAAVLVRKQTEEPKLPHAAEDDPLARLALEMLDRAPARRPTLAAVRARLEGVEPLALPSPSPQRAAFTGREEELARLHEAFERTCDDGLVVVLIEGESGLGKSALMAELLRSLAARVPSLLALTSRCYESEQVALKAFDGGVDQLARSLRALPAPACEAVLPKRAALLAQLFPVLGSVPSIAQASKRGLPADPGVRQRAALSCFVELLVNLSQRFELMLAIDDLQWADGESLRLLEILREHRAQLPCLFVCTIRPHSEIAPALRAQIAALQADAATEVISLGGLSSSAADQLIRTLTSEPPPPERLARMLAEAKGHPLFLRELVEQARVGAASAQTLTLDLTLRRRIESVEPTARSLLSLVAVAGKPYRAHVFARALAGTPGLREIVVALLGCGLLRASGTDGLAVFHDRIAQVALSLLTPEQTRALARTLACALEREPDVEPGERARLWDAAGDAERACAAYLEAGDRALGALQFVAADQHYARALALLPAPDDERRRTILAHRGDALARAGRCAEAARMYQEAAEGALGELAARLRTRAAEQAIQSGQAAWGLAAARALLEELQIPVPMGRPKGALLRIAWNRAALALQGRRPRVRATTLQTRMQLDAAWALALPMSWLDPLAGATLTTHHLRLALASGEPAHTTRALAADAFAYAVTGISPRRSDALIARARELASTLHDPALTAEVGYRDGVIATYRWDMRRAREQLERALQEVTERCPDQPWLTTNIRLALGAVWFNLPDHAHLARVIPGWLAEARDRGDQLAQTALHSVGYGFATGLMADDPDGVLTRLDAERAAWPVRPFSFLHFGDLVATSYALLYRADARAWGWLERERPRLERAPLLRFGMGRAVCLTLRTAAALAAFREADGERARALLSAARRLVTRLAGLDGAFERHLAPYLQAQLDALDGERARALTTARRVQEVARNSGFVAHAHRAEYLAAALIGGSVRHETYARLHALYAEQGWQRPERALTLLCPVIAHIEAT